MYKIKSLEWNLILQVNYIPHVYFWFLKNAKFKVFQTGD